MIKPLKKHQRLHHSVALYRWQITMRLAAEIDALKKSRRTRRSRSVERPPEILIED